MDLSLDGGRVTLAIWRWQGKASPAKALTLELSPPAVHCGSPLRLHAINMLRPRKGARANVGRIAFDRRLDHRAEITIAADEFRGPRRQSQHILQHQDLTV